MNELPEDWRLQGQEKFLKGASLTLRIWSSPNPRWDHDHCTFCWAKIAAASIPDAVQDAYATADLNHCLPTMLRRFPGEIRMAEPGHPMIHVQLEESDFLQGSLLAARWSVKRWVFVAFIPSALYLGIGLFLMFSHATSRSCGPLGLFILLLVPAGWILGVLTRLFYFPYRARKVFRERKRMSRPFTLSWDEHGLTVDNENGHMLMPWGDFVKWLQDESVLLLFTSRILYMNIPKRTFASGEQMADFIAHLAQKVNPGLATPAEKPAAF